MKKKFSAKKLCLIAAFTALNVVMSSFGLSVTGGKIYLNDAVICFAALSLDLFYSFVVGGAVIKLPFQIAQALTGAVAGSSLFFAFKKRIKSIKN